MMRQALRACGHGLWVVLQAPLLVVGVLVVTAAVAVPFGLVVRSRVQASLAGQPPLEAWQGDIDPEWWAEFRDRASGLEATFTPAIIGAAAPLDSLSAMLDGTAPPIALALPVGLAVLAWSWLWGGVLDRFRRGAAAGPRGFAAAGLVHLPRFVLISAASLAAVLILYLTVHRLLFGPVYSALAAQAGTERAMFIWRLVLYAVFGILIGITGLVADYARIALVSGRASGAADAIRIGARFVARRAAAAWTVWAVVVLVNGALLAGYVALEAYGGSRVGGWRAVVIGQAYIVSRLVTRLAGAAAEVRVFGSWPAA